MLSKGNQIGPYTLVSKIGKGGFGEVWLAERRSAIATTKVALKIPLEAEIDLNSIKQEADLWIEASGHPNVLPIVEANIYNDQVIIASEYVSDGSLEDWLRKHNNIAPSVEAATEMILGILSGLEHLHSRQIIHRDLKPANLLLQGETPRLADFGISRILKSTSQSATVAGTPVYMAPEAFDGKRNEQTDIWSVGVIFYQLLSGQLPFPYTDMASLIGSIMTKNPAPLPPVVPQQIRQIIDKSLNKDPSQRYRSATEMKTDLRKAIQTIPDPLLSTKLEQMPPATKLEQMSPSTKLEQMPPVTRVGQPSAKSKSSYLVLGILAGVFIPFLLLFGIGVFIYKSGIIDKFTTNKTSTAKIPRPIVQLPKGISFQAKTETNSKAQKPSAEEVSKAIAKAKSNPKDYKAQNDAAIMVNAIGDNAQAKEFIEIAQQLAPQDPIVIYNYARILYELGLRDEAIAKLQDVLEVQPQFAEVFVILAIIYIEKEDYKSANSQIEQAQKINPSLVELLVILGVVLLLKEDIDGALKTFEQVTSLDPDNAIAFYNLGIAYQAKNSLDKAEEYYKQAYKKDPSLKEAENILATFTKENSSKVENTTSQDNKPNLEGTWNIVFTPETQNESCMGTKRTEKWILKRKDSSHYLAAPQEVGLYSPGAVTLSETKANTYGFQSNDLQVSLTMDSKGNLTGKYTYSYSISSVSSSCGDSVFGQRISSDASSK